MAELKTKSLKFSSGFNNASSLTGTSNFNSAALAKRRKEKQGPTDWTHLGLKSKNRDEKNREDAWKDWKNSQSQSRTILYDIHSVVPVVKVERHPLHMWYNERLSLENESSNERTRSRLLMKRFVFDVQELWLANLEHLREHQSTRMFTHENDTECEPDDYQRGKGLKNRRDIKEISAMNHQIQAVSQKRAFSNAYHTTRLPQVNLILDYVAFRTPTLPPHIPLPPQIRSIISQLRLEPRADRDGLLFPSDGNPCSTVASHCLNIQRLIPSADYISMIGQDILWRLELIESKSLCQTVFTCKEDDLVQYITVALLHTQPEYQSTLLFQSSGENRLPLLNGVDGLSSWRITEFNVSAKRCLSSKSVQLIIQISICNSEIQNSSNFVMELQFSIFEMYTVIYEECGEKIPIFEIDLTGLSMTLRSIPWASIFSKVKVNCDPSLLPTSLQYDEADGFLKNIDGALSDIQARGCAYELLHLLRFSSLHGNCNITAPTINGISVNLVNVTKIQNDKRVLFRSMHREVFLEDKKTLSLTAMYGGLWEELLEYSTCLSMHANNLNYITQDIPGSCEMGKKGLWFPDELDASHEKTQCAAMFFRDPIRSSTDTIMVNMTLALEAAILFKPVVAWENFSHSPCAYPAEESRGVPTLASQYSWNNLLQGLRSPIEGRIASTIVIYGTFPVEGVDYLPRDAVHRPIGFRRFVPLKNVYGFREQLEVHLLSLDAHVDSHVYGITKSGAIANNVGVNSRNIWHNVIAISEHINR